MSDKDENPPQNTRKKTDIIIISPEELLKLGLFQDLPSIIPSATVKPQKNTKKRSTRTSSSTFNLISAGSKNVESISSQDSNSKDDLLFKKPKKSSGESCLSKKSLVKANSTESVETPKSPVLKKDISHIKDIVLKSILAKCQSSSPTSKIISKKNVAVISNDEVPIKNLIPQNDKRSFSKRTSIDMISLNLPNESNEKLIDDRSNVIADCKKNKRKYSPKPNNLLEGNYEKEKPIKSLNISKIKTFSCEPESTTNTLEFHNEDKCGEFSVKKLVREKGGEIKKGTEEKLTKGMEDNRQELISARKNYSIANDVESKEDRLTSVSEFKKKRRQSRKPKPLVQKTRNERLKVHNTNIPRMETSTDIAKMNADISRIEVSEDRSEIEEISAPSSSKRSSKTDIKEGKPGMNYSKLKTFRQDHMDSQKNISIFKPDTMEEKSSEKGIDDIKGVTKILKKSSPLHRNLELPADKSTQLSFSHKEEILCNQENSNNLLKVDGTEEKQENDQFKAKTAQEYIEKSQEPIEDTSPIQISMSRPDNMEEKSSEKEKNECFREDTLVKVSARVLMNQIGKNEVENVIMEGKKLSIEKIIGEEINKNPSVNTTEIESRLSTSDNDKFSSKNTLIAADKTLAISKKLEENKPKNDQEENPLNLKAPFTENSQKLTKPSDKNDVIFLLETVGKQKHLENKEQMSDEKGGELKNEFVKNKFSKPSVEIEDELKKETCFGFQSVLESTSMELDADESTKVGNYKEINTPKIEKKLSSFVSPVEVDTPSKVLKKRGRPRKNLEKMKIEQTKEIVDLQVVDTAFGNKKCVDVNIKSNETESTHSRSDMSENAIDMDIKRPSKSVVEIEDELQQETSFNFQSVLESTSMELEADDESTKDGGHFKDGKYKEVNTLKIETKLSGFVSSVEVGTPSKILKKRGRPGKNLEKMKIEQTKGVVDLQVVDTTFGNKKCVDVNIESNETESTHSRSLCQSMLKNGY
ncbi:hypothetical protein JTB14_011830 [Gonioctena quinquepunctata]|nr:hypothetical protein JTB14_011830 [Gonioctena quinquepunctata]